MGADRKHFEHPMITITATASGWTGILVAAGLSRRFSTRRNIVHFTADDLENLKNTSAGLLVIGLFSQILLTNYNTGGRGTIWTALNQLNIFIPMATILATYYEICISRGTAKHELDCSRQHALCCWIWFYCCLQAGHVYAVFLIFSGLCAAWSTASGRCK